MKNVSDSFERSWFDFGGQLLAGVEESPEGDLALDQPELFGAVLQLLIDLKKVKKLASGQNSSNPNM